MQSAFPIVVFGAVGISVVMSIVFLLSKGSLYDEIGKDGLPGTDGRQARPGLDGRPPSRPHARTRARTAPPMSEAVLAGVSGQHGIERDEEIRQMLRARNERRARRGEPELDVESELARLTAQTDALASAQQDRGIEEEVLQLVVARNERRERRGLEPLDVEAEVARTLTELNP
ncbi:MAG TPA: hypothetical protein VMH33_01770 [Solirubrobacterales bacterium]|nr:hypothetical protein [Solirubrobacterales bacterium]